MHRYLVGTLFEEEEQGKKMNIHSMKAKDPQGNTRWKGAFTGGFEAGFRNTCGSKEGWTPATFVSSVLNRADKKEHNIFDYMDKEDLGRETLGENISLRQNFAPSAANPFNISKAQSIGQQLLAKMKKREAYLSAPEDIKQLHKLLENYEKEETIHDNAFDARLLKGIDNFFSVGTEERPQEDDFIAAYEDFFKKVIRTSIKEETEEDRAKRMEENKIYFDFTKPLETEPEYLREIQEIEDLSQPKKRRKNVITEQRLKAIFKMGKLEHILAPTKIDYQVPSDYDPYHRIKDLQEKDKKLMFACQEKPKHKIHQVSKRSDLIGEGKLNSRFVSATVVGTNKFVRAGQDPKAEGLVKIFEDEKKNQRYWDYVMEVEGKKISAQLECLDFEEAEREKREFEETYRLRGVSKDNSDKALPKKVQEALKANKQQVKVIRTHGVWKPAKLLCKRFACVMPYREEDKQAKNSDKYF